MDRDIRSNDPGKCPRCGMELVAGIPDPTEYHLDLAVVPQPPQPNEKVRLTFEVFDPWKDRPVTKIHGHPRKALPRLHRQSRPAVLRARSPHVAGRRISLRRRLAKPGMYRILGDFYPEGATPQLITKTIFVSGSESPAPPCPATTRRNGRTICRSKCQPARRILSPE